MNPKTKKVLAEQGAQVAQALKWIGGAIFGDADDVLDDMAQKGDEQLPPPKEPPRAKPLPRRPPPPPPPRQVIDVEGFIEDEEDDETRKG